MIKTLKIISLFVLALLLVVAGTASAADVSYTADATVDLSSPDIDLTIVSGSAATSVAVGTGTLTVAVPIGSTFTVASASRALTSNTASDATFTIVPTCSVARLETTVITAVSAEKTIILTPGANQCIPNTGGGGGGNSYVGSSSYITATPATTTAVTPVTVATTPVLTDLGCTGTNKFSTTTGKSCIATAAQVMAGCSGTNKFSTVTGQLCEAVSTITPAGYSFGTTLVKLGTKGPACEEWQRYLNDTTNAGLTVDGVCGGKTIVAAKAWQTSKGISPDGVLGVNSRTVAMSGSPLEGSTGYTAPVATTYNFGQTLVKMGSKGEACKAWQMYLNDNFNAGLTADGVCGGKTMASAKAWQASVGLTADGFLGSQSRAKALGL